MRNGVKNILYLIYNFLILIHLNIYYNLINYYFVFNNDPVHHIKLMLKLITDPGAS